MRMRLPIAFLVGLLLAAGNARAVTLFVLGDSGASGSSAADSSGIAAAGVAGGAGGNASAVANTADPDNEPTAVSGDGGAGGNGGNSTGPAGAQPSIGGAGGDGGPGGAALATVVNPPAPGPGPFGLSASAIAAAGSGGTGGMGGLGLDAAGVTGRGGAGGEAEADTSIVSHTNDASVMSFAVGGLGGLGPNTAAGRGGNAVANATATGLRFANADAEAYGGDHPGGAGEAGSWLDGSRAEAHATATSDSINGSATATAAATGGNASHTSIGGVDSFGTGGTAVATATASALGDAYAGTTTTAGAGYYDQFGSGGPGTDITVVDAVSGRSETKLTLSQTANAGYGGVGAEGGDAVSSLHATNPGAGALIATSVASGGGLGHAIVVATSSSGAAVNATAKSFGGLDDGQHIGSLSEATAIGQGRVDAYSEATGYSTTVNASAERLTGPIAGVHSSYSLITRAGSATQDRNLSSYSTFVDTPGGGVQNAILARPDAQGFFAAPSRADVFPLAPGTNAQHALPHLQPLALGIVRVAAAQGDSPELIGSLSLDLRADSFAESSHVIVALTGGSETPNIGVDLLHLQVSKDGTIDYDQSFTTRATALAAVSDSLIDLGELGPANSALRQIVLTLDGMLTPTQGFGGNPNVLTFNVVMFVSAPEPAIVELLCVAGLALYLTRRPGRLTPP